MTNKTSSSSTPTSGNDRRVRRGSVEQRNRARRRVRALTATLAAGSLAGAGVLTLALVPAATQTAALVSSTTGTTASAAATPATATQAAATQTAAAQTVTSTKAATVATSGGS
jgi:uncharacterized iron-regulated membrane protein